MLNASQRRVNKNSLTWWYVLKTSSRYLSKTSWRRLQNVLKTSSRCLENVLKTYGQDEYIFWRRNAKGQHIRLDQDVFIKTNVCWVFKPEPSLSNSSAYLTIFSFIFSGFLFPLGYYKTTLSVSAVADTCSYFLWKFFPASLLFLW